MSIKDINTDILIVYVQLLSSTIDMLMAEGGHIQSHAQYNYLKKEDSEKIIDDLQKHVNDQSDLRKEILGELYLRMKKDFGIKTLEEVGIIISKYHDKFPILKKDVRDLLEEKARGKNRT